jgi:hypothetical protein
MVMSCNEALNEVTNRVGNGGCPGPRRQTEPKRPARKSQSISAARRTSEWRRRWTKQIVLTIVARLAHGVSPTANLAGKGKLFS